MAVTTPTRADQEVIHVGGPHPGFDGSEDEFCAMVEELVG